MQRSERDPSCLDSLAHDAQLRNPQTSVRRHFSCALGNPLVVSPATTRSDQRTTAVKEIGERIRFARKRRKMTKAALARHCGFADPSSITRVEQGIQMLDVLPLIAAARALDATIDWLLTGSGELSETEPAAPEDTDRRRRT
jgi:ribosome-binding protein aMBF1 (putative translation factor)